MLLPNFVISTSPIFLFCRKGRIFTHKILAWRQFLKLYKIIP